MPFKVFVFECNNETYGECIERNLFGSNVNWPLQVKKGDFCFLYHYGVHQVFALWEATSDGCSNIVPGAWNRRYPFQVRVKLSSADILNVSRSVVNQFITNPQTHRAFNTLLGDRAHNLIQFFAARVHRDFEQSLQLSDLDRDYRRRFPADFICEDGHRVRSQGEMIIDNWLYHHRVPHAVEPIIANIHDIIPDFLILDREDLPVYIEYWGMKGDPVYDERMRIKYAIYQRNHLRVIGIRPQDLQNIDESMRADLHQKNVVITR